MAVSCETHIADALGGQSSRTGLFTVACQWWFPYIICERTPMFAPFAHHLGQLWRRWAPFHASCGCCTPWTPFPHSETSLPIPSLPRSWPVPFSPPPKLDLDLVSPHSSWKTISLESLWIDPPPGKALDPLLSRTNYLQSWSSLADRISNFLDHVFVSIYGVNNLYIWNANYFCAMVIDGSKLNVWE